MSGSAATILRGALSALAFYAVWLTLAWLLQREVLFPRSAAGPLAPPPQETEVWRVDTADGPVEAWFFAAGGPGPRPAVIAAHGNAETIAGWVELAAAYNDRGLHVLLPEYRGYGGLPGRPSQAAITADFEAFAARLAADARVDPGRIVYHGRSLGGGVVLALAARRAPAAVIVESTFTSVRAFTARYLIPPALVRDPFDSLAVVSVLDAPLLILHGRPDTIVPAEHGRALAASARRARLVLHDRDHNDPPPPEYWPAIDAFLAETIGPA